MLKDLSNPPKIPCLYCAFSTLNRPADSGCCSEISIYLTVVSEQVETFFCCVAPLGCGTFCVLPGDDRKIIQKQKHARISEHLICSGFIFYWSCVHSSATTFTLRTKSLCFRSPQLPRPYALLFFSCDSWFPCSLTTGRQPFTQCCLFVNAEPEHTSESAAGKTDAETSSCCFCCAAKPCSQKLKTTLAFCLIAVL